MNENIQLQRVKEFYSGRALTKNATPEKLEEYAIAQREYYQKKNKLNEHLAKLFETQHGRFALYYRVLPEAKKEAFRHYLQATRPWIFDGQIRIPVQCA